MTRKPHTSRKPSCDAEIGTIRKDWAQRISVALVYPNTYAVGMSNLGFQTVYTLLNRMDHVVCERAFLSEKSSRSAAILSVESERPLRDFDIIAFSISFENDYLNILRILDDAGIALHSDARDMSSPLIIAGGVACFLNPEPIADFMDAFLIGEAESLVDNFFNRFDPETDRKRHLKKLAQNVPGVYVPSFYKTVYHPDGTLKSFDPLIDVPPRIRHMLWQNLSQLPTCSAILTPKTTFSQTYLIELSRGCPHGCRFCSAGYIYRPPRFRPYDLVEQKLLDGAALTDRIGLVGAAVSDFPGINKLCSKINTEEIRISFSSLRADALSPELIATLRRSHVKTATIAPEAGSERMRNVISKGITEEQILTAAEKLVDGGIPNLKLYFMIGLPTETADDIDAIVALTWKIKQKFLNSSRIKKHIGHITVSVNPFIPKPVTPFQWVAMDQIGSLKKKIRRINDGLKSIANVRFQADNPRRAFLHTLLSRGNRRVSELLTGALSNQGNWPKTFKAAAIDPEFYVYRNLELDELLPWDFIDHGLKKSFLIREYQRALQSLPSPPCPVKPCNQCRICKVIPDDDQHATET